MKKLLLLAFLPALVTTSCKKDDSKKVDTGSIRYVNNSQNPYDLYLDGAKFGQQPANSYSTKTDVPTGSHIVKAVQASGYVLYPTTTEKTINVTKGQETMFIFP